MFVTDSLTGRARVMATGPTQTTAAPPQPAPEPAAAQPAVHAGQAPHASNAHHSGRRAPILLAVAIVVLAMLVWFGIPLVREILNTVSTDDAYVNGHVTFVAPRVAGQVTRVLVDDNNRVHVHDLLVELDPKPYQLQVEFQQAELDAAQADLLVAQALVRSYAGQARSQRFKMQRAIETVDNQIAQLRAKVALYQTKQATLARTKADYERGLRLLATKTIAQEDFDLRLATYRVAEADANEALEEVYQARALLGLPRTSADPNELNKVPPDLDQTQSAVREAMYAMLQSVAQLGIYPTSYELTPQQVIEEFLHRDPSENIDRIYEKLVRNAPAVKQAETKVEEAQASLDQANLNLSYCKIYSDIDGLVTRRNVNPGNNVQVGQGLMAVRSFREVWVDANFKETQLDWIRIGQPVDLYVDMYGSHRVFKGRVSGFTMGTGSTLSLLPAENATGNFVKVVQRLPVRIDLAEPNPEDSPLFVGLSVTPYVNVKETPSGPDAGKFLQPYILPAAEPSAPKSAMPAAISPGSRLPTAGGLPSEPAMPGTPASLPPKN